MKTKLLTLLVLTAGLLPLQAQAPSGMNYQAALRNNAGAVLANQNVSLRFTIRDGGVAGRGGDGEVGARGEGEETKGPKDQRFKR